MKRITAEWRQREFVARVAGRVAENMERAAAFAADRARDLCTSDTVRKHITHEVTARGMVVEGWVGVKKAKSYIGWWLELGTSRHTIKVRQARVLSDQSQVFGVQVEHPGMAAKPFLRPAVFGNAAEIVRILAGKK